MRASASREAIVNGVGGTARVRGMRHESSPNTYQVVTHRVKNPFFS